MCHVLHPLQRNPWLLSARISTCSPARAGRPTLPLSFAMFLLGNAAKITQVFPCINCLTQLPMTWHDTSKEAGVQDEELALPCRHMSCRTCWQLGHLNSTGSLFYSFASWSIQRPTTATPVRWYVCPSKGGLWSKLEGKTLPLIFRGDNLRSF